MEEEVQGVVAEAGTVPVWRRSTEVAVLAKSSGKRSAGAVPLARTSRGSRGSLDWTARQFEAA